MQRRFHELLVRGVSLGREGRHAAAIEALEQAVQLNSDSADAWFNLGVAQRANSRNHEAIEAFERSVKLKPDWAEAWFNLGNSLRDADSPEQAIRCFEQAIVHRPKYPKALNNLGNLYCAAAKLDQAEQAFLQALQQQPRYPEALFNLGRVYKRQRKFPQAIQLIEQALALQPGNARYLLKLADLQQHQWNPEAARATLERAIETTTSASAALQLAQLHRTQKNDAQALSVLEDLAASAPLNIDALCLRSEVKRSLGRIVEAVADLQQAAELEPNSARVHNLLGVTFLAKAEPQNSLFHHDEAVRLKPAAAEFHNNRGAAQQALSHHAESKASFQAALRLRPDFAVAHLNYALACFGEGDLETGWREFEWRFLCPDFKMKSTHLPRWNGEDLEGKTIVLRAEQGLGDTIQFVRYVRQLKDRGARVIVECQGALTELVATCPGVDQVIRRGERLPKADVQLPMMSIPGVIGTSLETIPNDVPYLAADRDRTELWRARLQDLGSLKIGIAWQGNRKFASDHLRSFHVSQFKGLAAIPGIALVSLQRNDGAEELREVGFRVHDFTSEMDNDVPFADTAAIISAVDLVISSDTSIVHLAGALGRPVWTMLGYAADWRWLNSGDRSPWYPTMRLFRQRGFNHWASAFEQADEELRQVMAGNRTRIHPPPHVERNHSISIPIPVGELFDRISILEIKKRKLTDTEKLQHVERELAELSGRRPKKWESDCVVKELVAKLDEANLRLWDVEDRLRDCERESEFGSEFVELARTVYRLNDLRAAAKRRLSEHFGSALMEVKSYKPY